MLLQITEKGNGLKYNDKNGRTVRRKVNELLHTAAPYGRVLVKMGFAELAGEHSPDGEAIVVATEAAIKLAKEVGVNLASVVGHGKDGRVTQNDVLRAIGESEGT